MAHYYFHLHGGGAIQHDEEGSDLPSHGAVVAAALYEARRLIGYEAFDGVIRLGQQIAVETQDRKRVHTLAFSEAVAIEC